MPYWSSPGYRRVRLSGATQLWSQNHCNYVTLLLPLNCLAKPRSHLQGGLGWMTFCSHITSVHQVVVQACSQPAQDLSSLTQLAPVSSSPAVAAARPSFAPQRGHLLDCQSRLVASVLPPAAYLCPACGSQSSARPYRWAGLGIFLSCWMVHFSIARSTVCFSHDNCKSYDSMVGTCMLHNRRLPTSYSYLQWQYLFTFPSRETEPSKSSLSCPYFEKLTVTIIIRTVREKKSVEHRQTTWEWAQMSRGWFGLKIPEWETREGVWGAADVQPKHFLP